MDDVDSTMTPKRPKVKDPFQRELHSKLRERKAKGLAADITSESDEDNSSARNDRPLDTWKPENRPSSAKHRDYPSLSDWNPRLGDTLRAQDIQRLQKQNILGKKSPVGYDLDERNEEDSADEEVTKALTMNQHNGMGWLQRKTPTPTQSHRTPVSQQSQEKTKEEIIFGRKTPNETTPFGDSDYSSLTAQKPWQPPNFRNISPTAEHQKFTASGKRTPGLELESINESKDLTPRQDRQMPRNDSKDQTQHQSKLDRRSSPGLSSDSPQSDIPTPRARHRLGTGEDKVNDKGGQQWVKDRQKKEAPDLTTPTLSLFGKSRQESSLEVESELKEQQKIKAAEERIQQHRLEVKGGRKSPGLTHQGSGDQKSTNGGRKTPTSFGTGRKSPNEKKKESAESPPRPKNKEESNASLLDFLLQEPENKKVLEKPRPKERPSHRSKIPKDEYKEVRDIGEIPEPQPPLRLRQSHSSSSFCEEVKEDPSRPKRPDDAGDGKKKTKTSETKKNEDAIEKVFQEQNRIDFKPLKTIRPVSAEPKVVSRPKPRYGTLPGEKTKDMTIPEFNSTMDIRDAVYEDWYRRRLKAAREKIKEKKRQEEAAAEKKRKAEDEKKNEALLSFKAWEENKKAELAKQKAKQRKEEEAKLKKEQEDRENKIVESEVSFKSWKEKKEEADKIKQKEKKEKEREKLKEEQTLKKAKEKDNETAFSRWKVEKDVVLTKKHKKEMSLTKTQKMEEEAKQREKEAEARDQYEQWLKAKEKQEVKERLHKTMQTRSRESLGESDYRPPWRPANHLVPFGR